MLLAFNVVMGGEGTFKQIFSASVHAFYIYTIGGLAVLGLMFLGSEQMVLSPGVFLPDSADGTITMSRSGCSRSAFSKSCVRSKPKSAQSSSSLILVSGRTCQPSSAADRHNAASA